MKTQLMSEIIISYGMVNIHTRYNKMHQGTDFAAPCGYADNGLEGKILKAGWCGGVALC